MTAGPWKVHLPGRGNASGQTFETGEKTRVPDGGSADKFRRFAPHLRRRERGCLTSLDVNALA